MTNNIISLDQARADAEDKDLQDFIEMCKRNAPEFIQIEEVTPSKAKLLVIHKNSE